MPAQSGGAVLLQYGPQGGQQPGGAVVLDAIQVATSTRVTASTRAPWSTTAASGMAIVAAMAAVTPHDVDAKAGWQSGQPRQAAHGAQWSVGAVRDQRAGAPWARFTGRAERESLAAWLISRAVDEAAAAPWSRYAGRAQPESLARWVLGRSVDQADALAWRGAQLRSLAILERAAFATSTPRDRLERAPWGRLARQVGGGWEVVIPIHQGAPEALVVVPVRRVYMQVNAISLRRVAGDIPLRGFSLNLSLDRDSWVWSFSAAGPLSALQYVEPMDDEPVELEAIVNGTRFRLLAEQVGTDRSFAKGALQISGRGRAAQLDAPTAPVLNFGNDAPRTAQQLMADVLTDNGVSLGWGLDFAPDDWLVPAGVFSHRGSYISAINTIAAAAGAYVQAHAADDVLQILRHYPAAPWDWAGVEPDFELPSALMTREGMSWVDKPRYNRVYVSGVQSGVLGQVTRAGTAGDLVAQMVTDPLITEAIAARQRGIPVLADTGRILTTSLRFPVLTETGIVTPGKFVRYVDGDTTRIGLARSVNVEAAGSAQVWQTISLEVHP